MVRMAIVDKRYNEIVVFAICDGQQVVRGRPDVSIKYPGRRESRTRELIGEDFRHLCSPGITTNRLIGHLFTTHASRARMGRTPVPVLFDLYKRYMLS